MAVSQLPLLWPTRQAGDFLSFGEIPRERQESVFPNRRRRESMGIDLVFNTVTIQDQD